MFSLQPLEPVDYLAIGHLTCDVTPGGLSLGGTVAYAALTAKALGLRVGVVTAWGAEIPLGLLAGMPLVSYPSERSTTFENAYSDQGRHQILHHTASALDYSIVPEAWRTASIVHLGPVAQEVEPDLVRRFPSAFIGVTPQGWMRGWDHTGRVQPTEWPEASFVLGNCGAAVISLEDVNGSEERVEELATHSRILAVTEGSLGARVYWNGDIRRFVPPDVEVRDATGAGDVFAAAFFTRLWTTRDPWEAARFATQLAAISVTRPGLEGIPTVEEIDECMVEVL
jgi:sugar/nucleoside kinase (ribokinase family)